MHGLLRCNARGGADVSLRDVTIAQMGNGARECGWRHAPEARGGFWGFWKSQLVELRTRLRTGRVNFRLLAKARTVALWRMPYKMGCRWKSHHRKIVHLSPYVEKPLNSKVIKSFVPELRSRKCFCVSGFLCSIYICYEYSMYVSHIRKWLCYTNTLGKGIDSPLSFGLNITTLVILQR